jgi:hypothetical protein
LKEIPRYVYQPEGEQFVLSPEEASSIPAGHRRGEMYRERFQLVQHILLKGENFVRVENFTSHSSGPTAGGTSASSSSAESLVIPRISVEASMSTTPEILHSTEPRKLSLFDIYEGSKFPLTPVESLPGSKGVAFALGYLIQPEATRFALEGLSLSVNLDLAHTEFSDDFINLHSLVLVKGRMDGNIFRVAEISLPTIGRRELFDLDSVASSAAGPATSGGRLRKRHHQQRQPRQEGAGSGGLETSEEEKLVVVLSDFCLERESTLEKLGRVLEGFATVSSRVPEVVVLMGSFVEREVGKSAMELRRYQNCFARLIDFLANNRELVKATQFILIPGPLDPGQHKLLPQFPLDMIRTFDVVARAKQLGISLTLAGNPARVRVGPRDLVLFREELTQTFHRVRINNADEAASSPDVFQLTAHAVLSQLHLYPVSASANKAVMWDFDAALRLHPIPHVLVVGESGPSVNEALNLNGCRVARAPSFTKADEFLMLFADSVEISQLPRE